MSGRGRHPILFRVVAGAGAVLFFVLLIGLGTWQIQRRAWKLDLIARVEHRVHAPPAAIPDRAHWAQISSAGYEYRHVIVTGDFIDGASTLVQAVTRLGPGFWVLTPMRTADGNIVLINRGFVAADDRDRVAQAGGADSATTLTGLIRMSEPGGGFLRHNDPAHNHWYSRDVQAIAAARGLTNVAPYFVDADAASPAATVGSPAASGNGRVTPVGGLTVTTFRNSHLIYAITWYTLALMLAGAVWLGIRHENPGI